jgi:hypothetical protein
MITGWIVEVEHPDGALLYAVAVENPTAAEELVSSDLNVTEDREVLVNRPLTILPFGLNRGAIKGPM